MGTILNNDKKKGERSTYYSKNPSQLILPSDLLGTFYLEDQSLNFQKCLWNSPRISKLLENV